MSLLNREYNVIRLSETESTNLYLKDLLLEHRLDEFTVVTTEFQTKGRGQKGNSWTSNRGENLLFSLLAYPYFIKPNEQFVISQAVSIALCTVLSKYVSDIKIKWPNDIYYKDSKIVGILIENNLLGNTIDRSIIGIGLNLNQNLFPDFLVNPISLSIITGNKYSADDVLGLFMVEFIKQYENIKTGNIESIVLEYMALLYRYNDDKFYLYEDSNGRFYAKIVEVKSSGHLVLQAKGEDGVRLYAFKEVQFIIEQ